MVEIAMQTCWCSAGILSGQEGAVYVHATKNVVDTDTCDNSPFAFFNSHVPWADTVTLWLGSHMASFYHIFHRAVISNLSKQLPHNVCASSQQKLVSKNIDQRGKAIVPAQTNTATKLSWFCETTEKNLKRLNGFYVILMANCTHPQCSGKQTAAIYTIWR